MLHQRNKHFFFVFGIKWATRALYVLFTMGEDSNVTRVSVLKVSWKIRYILILNAMVHGIFFFFFLFYLSENKLNVSSNYTQLYVIIRRK